MCNSGDGAGLCSLRLQGNRAWGREQRHLLLLCPLRNSIGCPRSSRSKRANRHLVYKDWKISLAGNGGRSSSSAQPRGVCCAVVQEQFSSLNSQYSIYSVPPLDGAEPPCCCGAESASSFWFFSRLHAPRERMLVAKTRAKIIFVFFISTSRKFGLYVLGAQCFVLVFIGSKAHTIRYGDN